MRGFLMVLFLCLSPSSWAAEVNGVRVWAGPEGTRVVFDLSAPVAHDLFSLRNPNRIVLDIERSRMGAKELPEAAGLLSRIRYARHGDNGLRVVLDLKSAVRPKSFLVKPNATYGHRLVVDLEPLDMKPMEVVKAIPTDRGRDIVIAIDAGHGGEDPGASGRKGAREKDVTLAIARELARQVNAEPGMRALLVRDGDYFIKLSRRIDIARKHRADMFVSIHADAFKDKRVSGASVYALSSSGASSAMAQRLAERENSSDLVGGVKLSDKGDQLRYVLLDLSQTGTLSASLGIGDLVLSGIGRVNKLHKKDVQQAGFAVLKSPDIPSILIETAFISNPDEERRLKDRGHQRRLSAAILGGVRKYFYQSPPPGTQLALARNLPTNKNRTYVISRGDTLSGIARRHRVNVSTLKFANNIRGDRIRVGDVLVIPGGT